MIQFPAQLRHLSTAELVRLAEDIRQRILSVCLTNGGHLGASLGTVELAIALHVVFDSPDEPILWDVGHQAYAHKLLTGRWQDFSKLRQRDGLSGFPSRAESPHDAFGVGHSSTALSVALASAWARRHSKRWTVTVVGDGGLSAGLAFEALNNASAKELGPLLLVVNDNELSISGSVGAMPQILSSRASEYFSHFGFDYAGKIDGHDLATLLQVLGDLKANARGRPVVLHALTQKGRGYLPAEERPSRYHGINPIAATGKLPEPAMRTATPTFSEAFGAALCDLAGKDDRVVAVCAAMPEGTGLQSFASKFPDRFFDVGIAEPHAVTFAAGLAAQGYRPVVAIYSTFLQRAVDGIIHDIALQRLPVTFAIDRAGLVGADGPTHHGMFDLSLLGMIPGVNVSAPACLDDLPSLLETAVSSGIPWAVRFPRGTAPSSAAPQQNGVRWLRRPAKPRMAVIALGPTAHAADSAIRAMGTGGDQVALVASLHAKPIPAEILDLLSANPHLPWISIEAGCLTGGFGQRLLTAAGRPGMIIGYPETFPGIGSPAELEEAVGLSPSALQKKIESALAT